MEQDNEKKVNKKKDSGNRPVYLIIGAVLLLYVGVQIFSAFSGGIQTTSTSHVTVNDSFAATAWFFRDETPVSGSASDTVRHIVYNGERVQQNAPLATVYADENALALSRELEALDNQITQFDTALQSAGDSADSAKIDQLIALALQQLSAQVKSGSGTSLTSAVSSLRSLSLRRSSGQLDAAAVSAEREQLTTQRDSLAQQLSGKTNQITAPYSGYFSEVLDGYESVLTLDQLKALTPEALDKLIKSQTAPDQDSSLGKIIQGFSWYLAVDIPADQAARLKIGSSLRISFTKASIEVPVTVNAINRSPNKDNNQVVVILEGAEFNSELVSMRDQPVDIILGSYEGLKVPKEAVRMVTDEDGNHTLGVYILSGSVTYFKTIHPIYEDETFYVVTQSATDSNALVVNDQIVVRGKGLQNNMVVKT